MGVWLSWRAKAIQVRRTRNSRVMLRVQEADGMIRKQPRKDKTREIQKP